MDTSLLKTALTKTGEVFKYLNPIEYDKPTPCSEWNVQELANHIVNELAWVEPLLKGKTISEVGNELDGDLIGKEPALIWSQYAEAASSTASETQPDALTHLSYGDKAAQAYLDEVSADIIIHGWDLAQALGLPFLIDKELAESVKKATEDIMPSGRENGYIAEAIDVPDSASEQEKLLAYYGRSVNWKK